MFAMTFANDNLGYMQLQQRDFERPHLNWGRMSMPMRKGRGVEGGLKKALVC